MKQVIVIVFTLFCCSLLLGTAFEDCVRDAGRELAGKITTRTPLIIVLDSTEASGPEAPNTARMHNYIRELLDAELGKSETLAPLDMHKTDPILADLANQPRDYRFFDELGRLVYGDLNQVTDALLECRIKDLDSIVKIELTLIDAKTVADLAKVKREYPADDQTNQLLGKTVATKPVVKHHELIPPSKPETKPDVTSSKVVFSEDFSGYAEGDPLPDWGQGVVVVKTAEGKKFVGSQIKGKHVIGRDIKIPNPGSISFSFSKVVENPRLVLFDNQKSEIRVALARNWKGFWVGITGSVSKQFNCEDMNQFELTREGDTFKVYINGKYMLSGVYEDFGEISGFRLDLYQGQLYKDFEIKRM